MADNKTKIDRIHDLLPKIFKTKANPNWKAIVEALGEQDELITELVQEVRDQFFVATADRPYLDRLGANVGVARPQQVGMDDATMRRFIPVLSYQPKQVKIILDQLLDIFFFRESTSAFTQSQQFEPFALKDGWQLLYTADGINEEFITFKSNDFTDIANATADEVVGVINRQAQNSFAVVFDDRVNDRKFIRLFTSTVGAKGSVQITGGQANIGLQFVGYNNEAGSQADTQWSVTKVGDTVTFQHIGGTSPNLSSVAVGDVALIDVPDNEGSFPIESIDLSNSSFSFTNLFGTPGVYDKSLLPDSSVNFMTPEKFFVYTKDNRAIVWETQPGQVIVEMPATPPVVKRVLEGSAHVNGLTGTVINRIDDTTLEFSDASEWPAGGGNFVLQPRCEIQTRYLTDSEDSSGSLEFGTRFDKQSFYYSFTGVSGNQILGIDPPLPAESGIFEANISTLQRVGDEVTVQTVAEHNFNIGESVRVQNTQSALATQGVRVDVELLDSATDVAAKTAVALNDLPGFTAVSAFDIVTTTTVDNNVVTDAADVDAGAVVNVIQQGNLSQPEITEIMVPDGASVNVVGSALRWNISDASGNDYHVWYVVNDVATEQTNPGMDDLVNSTFKINAIDTPTSFRFTSAGESGNATGGISRVERIGITSGSIAYLTSARLGTGVLGPNVWDTNASFVLSSLTSNITEEVRQGTNVKTLGIDAGNNIPDEEGFVIFGFGTENQEGPVRYLFKPNDNSMQIDPAYFFENTHAVGTAITVIRRRGAHTLSSDGREFAPYITDPGIALSVLQDLLLQVKSVGISMDFLIRYPEQLYATLDVYRSCSDLLYPISEEAAADCE
jgi:hypothetical protein